VNHPALDAFGDLDAAARDPHVMSCAQCQTELATQQQVHHLLSSLPDPGPVPPEVVERIESTLRDLARGPLHHPEPSTVPSTETPESTSTPDMAPDAEPSTAAATVVPLQSAPSARRRRPLLAVAAAAVILVGGGAVISQTLRHSSTADSGAAAMQDKSTSQSRGLTAEGASAVRVVASGTDYRKAQLASQVDQQAGKQASSAADDAAGLLATPKGLAGCLTALGATATPSFVDVARFEGKPAAVIVLPSADGGREIWVVSPSCSPGKDGLRYFTNVP
jgi:hypothetical protein